MVRRKAYPLDANGEATYLRSLVLTVDILGYKAMALEVRDDQSRSLALLRRLRSTLVEAGEAFGRRNPGRAPDIIDEMRKESPTFSARFFTDNVVVGWPVKRIGDIEDGLVESLFACSQFQMNMACEGFFVRGGLALGEAFIDEYAVFGPAFFESYALESGVAIEPRVILSKNFESEIRTICTFYGKAEESSPGRLLVIDEEDGHHFVNYLIASAYDFVGPLVDAHVPRIRLHRQRIMEALKKEQGKASVLLKYEWVADYHNYVVGAYFRDDPSLRVSVGRKQRRFRPAA